MSNVLLASKVGPSHERGGEIMIAWKPRSKFKLQDESIDEEEDELMVTSERREGQEEESYDDR